MPKLSRRVQADRIPLLALRACMGSGLGWGLVPYKPEAPARESAWHAQQNSHVNDSGRKGTAAPFPSLSKEDDSTICVRAYILAAIAWVVFTAAMCSGFLRK